jgi:DNA-binding transcriptional MerR regulator
MRIGELADRVAVNTKTIRYYESIGLLPEPQRTGSGYRDYADDDEARLLFIRTAQHLGLSLDEIREVLHLREAGTAPCDHVRSVLQQQVQQITRRIAELRRLRDELRQLDAVIGDLPEVEGGTCRIIDHVRATAEAAAGSARRAPIARP